MTRPPTVWALCRVSTREQNLDRQIQAAKRWAEMHPEYGRCEIVEESGISGAARKRPKMDRILAEARAGDAFWCSELSRVGRSLSYTLEVLHTLHERGVRIVVDSGNLDFGSPMGRAFAAIVAVLAALERDILRERTMDGLSAARARGVVLGRRPDRWDDETVEQVRTMLAEGMTPYGIFKSGALTVWRPVVDKRSGKWTEKPVRPGETAVYSKCAEVASE